MWYIVVFLLAAASVLTLMLLHKNRQLADVIEAKTLTDRELANAKLQIQSLNGNIERLQETVNEIKNVTQSKTQRKKKDPAPAGDVDSRLDRLNSAGASDGVQAAEKAE